MPHLLGLKDIDTQVIKDILNRTVKMKAMLSDENKKYSNLKGKSVINVFYENSTRTRVSFELAAKYLGADAVSVSSSGSSVAKGETLIDTVRTIEAMKADVIVIRHGMSGAPKLVSENVSSFVVNAGDGMNEHPTQALLDMFTMCEYRGGIEGLKVAIVGDIKHSRVARSNIYGLTKMGAKVSVAAPYTLMPESIENLPVEVNYDVEDAIKDADIVMGLRIQMERQSSGLFPSAREYSRFFGIDDRRLALAKPNALVMHPGPVNRGVEMTTSVIDGSSSKINEQVTNGVAVRMAILDMLIGG